MQAVYYIGVLFTLLYFIFYTKKTTLHYIIIFSFYAGLAAYPGKIIENPYKIVLVILTLLCVYRYEPFRYELKKDKLLKVTFILFTVHFFVSCFLNDVNLVLMFSQYGRYLVPFLVFAVFRYIQFKNIAFFYQLSHLFLLLLIIQIVLSILKFVTLGMTETIVGSIIFTGGGLATLVPVIGFILIWLIKQGKLKKENWYLILALLIVSIMSYKRAIWFVFPVTIFLFSFYVPKKKISTNVLWILPLIPLIFYLGARLNPSLNKEGKIWGDFDYNYVIDYVKKYNFGIDKEDENKVIYGTGRGGATLMLLNKLSEPSELTWNDYFGYGLDELVTTNYDSFDIKKFNLNSKGAVTGFFYTYINFGFIGVILFLTYLCTIISFIQVTRIRYVMLGLFLWEYFFYIGTIFTTPAISILFIYIIVYLSNIHDVKQLPVIRLNKKVLA